MDYGTVTRLFMLDSCKTRQCIEITVRNDAVLENMESFFVNLLQTADLDSRINLYPAVTVIEIIDDDGLLSL